MNDMNNRLTDITERQLLRGRVLELCRDSVPLGASTQLLRAALKKEGWDVVQQDIITACNYLEGKKLIEIRGVKNDVMGIHRDIAHITPDGIDVLEGKPADGVELA